MLFCSEISVWICIVRRHSHKLFSFSFLYYGLTILQEGQSLADHRGLFFWETSAMSGQHISELLYDVGE